MTISVRNQQLRVAIRRSLLQGWVARINRIRNGEVRNLAIGVEIKLVGLEIQLLRFLVYSHRFHNFSIELTRCGNFSWVIDFNTRKRTFNTDTVSSENVNMPTYHLSLMSRFSNQHIRLLRPMVGCGIVDFNR